MPSIKVLLLLLAALVLAIPDADARRLSGGRSIGKQREAMPRPAPTQPPAAAPAPASPNPASAAPAAGGRWLGPVAGLLAGFGLGALFANGSGAAMLGGLLTAALIGLALVFVTRAALRARVPAPAAAGAAAVPAAGRPWFNPGDAPAAPIASVPPDFDAAAFARHAKLNFVRLQQAYDDADVSALKDVVTDEVYRDLEATLARSAPGGARSEVVALDAQVTAVVVEGDHYLASIRFSGELREGAGAPEAFSETWHLEKPRRGPGGWLVAGIQQD